VSRSPDPGAGAKPALIDWDAQGQPRSRQFGDWYFSSTDGLAESRYVFLESNNLAQRFAALSATGQVPCRFVVGETGFGSGLNFLACWQLWREKASKRAQLHYLSLEKYPLSCADLARALALWPELSELARALEEVYPPPLGPGFVPISLDGGRVRLTLILDDALTGLEQLQASGHPEFCAWNKRVDAWFLDGFAPAKNPELWQQPLFDALARLSHPGTSLATFSSASLVRQGLTQAGFATVKKPGFGLKREMLTASYTGSLSSPSTQTRNRRPPPPWPLVAETPTGTTKRRILVVGGGLSGCHSARALAQRGWQVTLLEQHPNLAREASGNPQGLLYAKLSAQSSPLGDFNLISLWYAQKHYRTFWDRGRAYGEASGLLQLAQTPAEQQLHQQLKQRFVAATELVQPLSPTEASHIAGLELDAPALYFPQAGWLNPAAVCRASTEHPGIEVKTGTEVSDLAWHQGLWQARDASGALLGQAPFAVLANARSALTFAPTAQLPLKAIRGQISQLAATQESEQLKVALCGQSYLAPALNGEHCIGASYNLKDPEPGVRWQDHQDNLAKLAALGPGVVRLFAGTHEEPLSGRVAFRCATPDYLPLVGPVPDRVAFLEDYAPLRKDARANIPKPGRYWPGLFVNLGHGSRGLAYTPLSAELLAAQITGDPLPLGRDLVEALHPGRFLIRDLMRNRV